MEGVEDVVIVGEGVAGLATAVALKKVGVRTLLMEKSKGLRSTGTALTLSPDDWLALDALGVSHKLIPPLYSFIQSNRAGFVHLNDGNFTEKFPSEYLDLVRHADHATVTGDATHPMIPDLVRGGGSSLEDRCCGFG
uniref:FAD-binding domain-containing protein n=1 Tax=Salix viminalis TaxID=40686 RepID=A0A6N2KAE5_SALVM